MELFLLGLFLNLTATVLPKMFLTEKFLCNFVLSIICNTWESQ